jgi:ribonuclease HII
MEGAVRVGIGVADVEMIEQINIRQATLHAMKEAAQKVCPDYLLVDSERVAD